jgi:hypothetical protein
MPLELHLASVMMEPLAVADHVLGELERSRRSGEDLLKSPLGLQERRLGDLGAVKVQQVEEEEHQAGVMSRVRRGLDQAERRDPVQPDAAELAVEVRLADLQFPQRLGRGRVL